MYFLRQNISLILILLLAIFISVGGDIAFQSSFPTGMQILLGHTFYTPLALPNGFWHIVGVFADNSAHRDPFFLILALFYWIVIGASLYWYFEEREGKPLAVAAILILAASPKWLFFAMALMR